MNAYIMSSVDSAVSFISSTSTHSLKQVWWPSNVRSPRSLEYISSYVFLHSKSGGLCGHPGELAFQK